MNIETSESDVRMADPSMSSRPPMTGGGGEDMKSMIYPYYGGNGVVIDVQVTREVTPNVINLNIWCQLPETGTRAEMRTAVERLYQSIKSTVGTDGRIRRQGGYSINPIYDHTGKQTNVFQGNLNALIRITKPSATLRISEAVEDAGCGTGWDVRMQDMQKEEMGALDELLSKLNTRKQLFEKLLGKKLTVVQSASLNTYIDGYSSYDPETNTAEAMTNLTVTFDLGTRATLPRPVPTPLNK